MSNAPGMTASEREYYQRIDARRKQAAGHWRIALRTMFPAARISVRTDARDYITASWIGGPSEKQVISVFHTLSEELQAGIPRVLRTRTVEEMDAYQRACEELVELQRKQEQAEHATDEAIDELLDAAEADEAVRAACEERISRAHEALERLDQEIEEAEAALADM